MAFQPSPQGLWLGQGEGSWEGNHSTVVPAGLGNREVKRAPSSSPGQRSPPRLFPPCPATHLDNVFLQRAHCGASSCHFHGSGGTFLCSKMSPLYLLFPGVNNTLLAEHPPSQQAQRLVAPVLMDATPAAQLCLAERFGKAP